MRRLAFVLLAGCHSAAAVPPLHDGAADTEPGPLTVVASSQLCKLLSARNVSDPTPNDVQHRANVLGADLGIPVAFGDTLYLLFGDTIGFAGIWGAGESHPDAVGFAPAAEPSALCDQLRIATLATSSDPAVAADFAAGAMAAPPGHELGEFIRNPAGSDTLFPFLPGDFEVPSGAFAAGDSIYLFYTTVVSRGDPTMKASYLARWPNPAPGAEPAYQILYAVDERFDDAGPLHGDFINIAAEVAGDHVYLFGTGEYRASPIHVARKRLDALATPGGFEELGEIIPEAGFGETSVRFYPELGRWLLLAEELLPGSNRIVAHTARAPEGPWGPAVPVLDMADPAFRAQYCCAVADDCQGAQFLNCDQTGFYGSYLLPQVRTSGDDFTVTYTLSSFAPYNVALFQTTFR